MPAGLEHEHTHSAIRARLDMDNKPFYVRDWVYGGIDGAITTFAIVAGVVGADLSHRVIVILGIANIVADGISMAASNYSGTKTEVDDYLRLRAVEKKHIAVEPDGEREELRQIMRKKGLEGETLEEVVHAISSNEEAWVEIMLAEEYGVSANLRSPWSSAVSTFHAFLACGTVPLLPFLLGVPNAFALSLFLTAIVFFMIGSVKSRWSLSQWWISGLETLVIGLFAAGSAYLIGYLLKGII